MSSDFPSPWDIPEPEPAVTVPDATGTSLADVAAGTPLTTEQELALWTARAHDLWHSALASGDSRTASTALATAFRSLKARIDHEQVEAETAAAANKNSDPNRPVTLVELDAIVREDMRTLNARGQGNCLTCGRPHDVPDAQTSPGENGNGNGSAN